jgi:hypothetical protein
MGIQKDLKEPVRKYDLVVVNILCVCVESFKCVEVWSFLVAS